MDALAVVFWYKRDLRSFLIAATGDAALVAELDWDDYKRAIVDDLIQRLASDQARYRDVLLQLMVDVAAMEDFPKLRGLEDSTTKVAEAKAAVNELRKFTKPYEQELLEQERNRERLEGLQKDIAERRYLEEKLRDLKTRYEQLVGLNDAQARGRALEPLLRDLFALFDLDPRAAFTLRGEQIDGSFSIKGSHFLLEAKWTREPIERKELDAFRAKIESKIENTLGLLISINGFQPTAVELHSGRGSVMLLMTGAELYAVLDGRIDLVDLLARKHRHASQTGEILIEAYAILPGS